MIEAHENIRKPGKYISYRRRGEEALTSNEQVEIRKIKQVLCVLLLKLEMLKRKKVLSKFDDAKRTKWTKGVNFFSTLYGSVMFKQFEQLQPVPRLSRQILDFELDDCVPFFKFRRAKLVELVHLLLFPVECKLDNRSKLSGEEVFLRGMYEMVSGETQYKIKCLRGAAATAVLGLVILHQSYV